LPHHINGPSAHEKECRVQRVKLTLPFPVDRLRFDYEGIGGASYRLPDNAEIGYSYIMFVITLVFIFVSQLMTMKVLFEDFMP
jgi:hypothetical protein